MKKTEPDKLKPKKEIGDYIMICPQCGSTDISPHGEEPGVYETEVAETFRVHVCNKCEHVGLFFPMVPVKKLKAVQKLIKAFKKKHKTNY